MQSFFLFPFIHSTNTEHLLHTKHWARPPKHGCGIVPSKVKGTIFSLRISPVCPVSVKVSHGHTLLNTGTSSLVLWVLWCQSPPLDQLPDPSLDSLLRPLLPPIATAHGFLSHLPKMHIRSSHFFLSILFSGLCTQYNCPFMTWSLSDFILQCL